MSEEHQNGNITYKHNPKGVYAHEWKLSVGRSRTVVLNVSEYDPEIGQEGEINLAATGPLTPTGARQVARMLETAADVYQGRKNQLISESRSEHAPAEPTK